MFSFNPDEMRLCSEDLITYNELLKQNRVEIEEIISELLVLEGMGDMIGILKKLCDSVCTESNNIKEYVSAMERVIWEYEQTEERLIEKNEDIHYPSYSERMIYWSGNHYGIDIGVSEWLDVMIK